MIKLGVEGKDKITGFTGIIVSRHQYITGCDQYGLSGKMDEKGEIGDNYQFDEGRIEVVGEGINKKEVASKTPGGPQPTFRSVK